MGVERPPCPCLATADVRPVSGRFRRRKSTDSRMSPASGPRACFRDFSNRSGGMKRDSTQAYLRPASCNVRLAFSLSPPPIAARHGFLGICRSGESSRTGLAANRPSIRAVRILRANLRPSSYAVFPRCVASMSRYPFRSLPVSCSAWSLRKTSPTCERKMDHRSKNLFQRSCPTERRQRLAYIRPAASAFVIAQTVLEFLLPFDRRLR